MYFFDLFLEQDPTSPPPTFLILKLFIRCLLVGVREWLGVGISLSYKWKQIGIFFRRIVYVYELFSTYIISSLLLAHHLWLIVDDHSYNGPGLSG
jgi:hypothetical protein